MARTLIAHVVAAAIAIVAVAGCSRSSQTASASEASPAAALGDVRRGAETFAAECAACHGTGGSGGIGPSLVGEKHRKNYTATVAWIEDPEPPMPKLYPAPLALDDVQSVAAYVQSL